MVKSEKNATTAQALTDELRARMESGDSSGAVTATLSSIDNKSLTVRELYINCLVPLLTGLGREWQMSDISVWREHVSSAICRDIIGAMAPRVSLISAKSNGQTVVLACPPEEQHDLGLRMFADLFRMAGWQAYFLGADVPVREIISAAQSVTAETIVLNAATHFSLISAAGAVEEISKMLPDVRILVTGPAYKGQHPLPGKAELFDPASLDDKNNGSG